MRNLHLLFCFAILTGCSRGTGGNLPAAVNLDAAHISGTSLGQQAMQSTGTFKSLYSFKGGSDGYGPDAGLTELNGKLYGTTGEGGGGKGCGRYGCGTVFSITPSGVETVLHSFIRRNGLYPAGLTNIGGTLYGTTYGGGSSANCYQGCGTIFTITPSGKETVLYSFTGSPDGANPNSGLVDIGGTLFGTTNSGGTGCGNCGTVFSITPSGTETVLHNFPIPPSPDGWGPGAGLTNVNGLLYGTTRNGAANNDGIVFTITPSGTESVLYTFQGGADGEWPLAGMLNVNGTLYGTTSSGGTRAAGTIFKITTAGALTTIYPFADGSEGGFPAGNLLEVGGYLYGAASGGANSGCSVTAGCGTIYKLATSGGKIAVLHRFTRKEGGIPTGSLIDVGGTLYGTTAFGGAANCDGRGHGCGAVFSVSL